MAVTQLPDYQITAADLPEVPSRLVFDADQANTYCQGAITAYSPTYDSIINMIEHFDGKYPRDPDELIKAGLNWVSNVPFRKAQTKLDAITTNRLNMYLASIYFLTLQFCPYEKKYEDKPEYFFLANPPLADLYAQKLGKILIETLIREERFLDDFLKRMTENQVKWGYASSVNREFDVLSEVIHNLDFAFERATKKQNIKMFIEWFPQRADDLYRLYREQVEIGWEYSNYDKEGLEEVLRWAFNKEKNASYESWEMIVRSFQEQLLFTFSNCPVIWWARIFNEELLDGSLTITEYKMDRNSFWMPYQTTLNPGRNEFRGTRLAYQKNFTDLKFCDMFHFYPDTGYTNTDVIQDMRGVGIYAYEEGIQYDLMRNAMNDHQFMINSLKFQTEFSQQVNQFELGQFGPFMLFPPGFPVLDLQKAAIPTISEAIGYLQYQDAEYKELTEQYNPQVSDRLKSRATNQQVLQVSQEVSSIKQEGAIIQLAALQHEIKMILCRMQKNLKEGDPGYSALNYFKTRVNQDLLPKREWPKGEEGDKAKRKFEKDFYRALIESVDTVVLDYVTNDLAKLDTMLRLTADNPYAQRYYKRRMMYALGRPYWEIEQFYPLDVEPSYNYLDKSIAWIENNEFWTTGEVPFSALQIHAVHLQAHLGKAVEVLKSVMAGRDIQQVNHWLTNMIPNAQQHLQAISQDPYQEQAAKEFNELLDNIIAQSKIVNAKAQQLARQQAQQMAEGQQEEAAGLDPETAAKIQEMQTMGAFKRQQLQENTEFRRGLKAEDQQFKQGLQRESQNQKLQQSAETYTLNTYGPSN